MGEAGILNSFGEIRPAFLGSVSCDFAKSTVIKEQVNKKRWDRILSGLKV
jgi:hypothetical protein